MWFGIAVGLATVSALIGLFTASYVRFRGQAEPPTARQSIPITGGRLEPSQGPRRAMQLDETEAQARRELERLYRRTGVGQAPGNGDDVRLRGGGSLSRTDYERYRSSVGGGLR